MFEDIFIKSITINIILRACFILVAFIIFQNFFVKIVLKFIKKLANKYNAKIISLAIDSIEKPLKIIILLTGVLIALISLPFNLYVTNIINEVYKISMVISIASCLLRLLDSYNKLQLQNCDLYEKKPVLKTLFPLLIKGTKFLIILVAVVIVAVNLGFEELKSLLAGVGIGGLAVAMAAQDLLKNVFGGFVVLTDKSFNTGDLIKIDSNEGVVEEVGIRSTKVRTIDQELIVVPNSRFAEGAVINYSRRGIRRVKQVIGATYGTSSEQLKQVIEKIQKSLTNNNMVVKDSIKVRFDNFGSSSLDILVIYNVSTSDYDEYIKIKEEINFDIMKIFEEEKVEFAFPSVSVYMEK